MFIYTYIYIYMCVYILVCNYPVLCIVFYILLYLGCIWLSLIFVKRSWNIIHIALQDLANSSSKEFTNVFFMFGPCAH